MLLYGVPAGQQAQAAGAKQPASCLHLPVPRVLLITVVFALMAIPLLLFTAGRVQVSTSPAIGEFVRSCACLSAQGTGTWRPCSGRCSIHNPW